MLRVACYVLCIFLVLTVIFFPLVQTRFSQTSYNEINSTSERLSGYQEASQIFKYKPWLGVGVGNYTAYLIQKNPNLPGYTYQPVHNVPLLLVTELGIVGCLLILIIIGAFITYHILHITYQSGDNKSRKLCYVLCVMCYALLILFDHYMYTSFTGLIIGSSFFGLMFLKIRTSDYDKVFR